MLTIYMSAQMCEAIEDFTMYDETPPPDLYQRFLEWVRRAEANDDQPE
ncbi:hypothetical protein [Krasilnikovia sp. MM14-A1259]